MQAFSFQRDISPSVVPAAGQASMGQSSAVGGMPSRTRMMEMASKRCVRGFSVIELMIGITVAAILLVIAVPSFRYITLSNRLTTTSNDIVSAIYTARMEAIKLNATTQLCSNSTAQNTGDSNALGTACTTETGAVFALAGTRISTGTAGIATPLKLNGDMVALRFTSAGLAEQVGQPAGTPYKGIIVDICTSSISSNNHRVISMVAGSIVTTTTSPGACP